MRSGSETANPLNPAPSVKTSPLADPAAFATRFAAAASKAGFRTEPFAEVAGCPLAAFTKRAQRSLLATGVRPPPRIYLSSGIHGDEPAPPLALLHLLERGIFDHRATWFLCPLLNPTGLSRHVRENSAGLDLNRDYKDLRSPEIAAHVNWLRRQPRFDVTFCVHEDWESQGFYLYELNPDNRPTLAPTMIEAVKAHCPIDPAATIDGRPIAEPGIIRPVSDPLMRENWPEAIYLRAHHTTLSYTIESPSAFPLAQRVATLAAALDDALMHFLQ